MSSSARDPHGSNSWYHFPEVNLNASMKLKADYQSPVCYSPNMTDFPYRYSPNRFNPKFNMTIGSTGHAFGRTLSEIYRSFIKTKIRSTATGKSKVTPTIPWLEFPGIRTGGEIEGRVIHTSTVDDLSDIMSDAYLNGVKAFHFFNAGMSTYPQNIIDDSVSLFERFKAYVETNPQGPAVYPVNSAEDEVSATGCTGPQTPNQLIPRINVISPIDGGFVEKDDDSNFVIRLEYENLTENWLLQPPCERAETIRAFLEDQDGNTHEQSVAFGETKIMVPSTSFTAGEGQCLLVLTPQNVLGEDTSLIVGPQSFYFSYQP